MMFSHGKVKKLNDYFLLLSQRPEKTVYFTRFNGFNSEIGDFLGACYHEARKNGVVLSGSLPQPMQGNVDYYYDKVGRDFQLSLGFLEQSLKYWDPTAGMKKKRDLAVQIYDSLYARAVTGVPKAELQQIFIKYMCWMYTRFRQMMPRLGEEQVPKLLSIAPVQEEELRFFSILSGVGCDIVLVQPQGDRSYLALDPTSSRSDAWIPQGQGSFPENFSLQWLQEKDQSSRPAPQTTSPLTGRNAGPAAATPAGRSAGPAAATPAGRSAGPAAATLTGRNAVPIASSSSGRSGGSTASPYPSQSGGSAASPHPSKTNPSAALPPPWAFDWGNPQDSEPEVEGLFAETTAFEAERELDTMLYEDSGLYRAHQYRQASAVFLKMTYEELLLFWDKPLKLRPSFEAAGQEVKLPVLLARISGVPDRNIPLYWQTAGKLWTDQTILIRRLPFSGSSADNPFRRHAPMLIRDGKLLRGRIRQLPDYETRFGMLRQEMQEHILDKIQFMIDKCLIKGTGKSGTEYVIIAAALFMDQQIIRQIQSFDFTSLNPKLLVIHTQETSFTLEDAILFLLLALIGFDVAMFIPTGFQGVEKYYTFHPFRDFQIGDYVYDLPVPEDEALRPREIPKEKGTFGKLWDRISHGKE